MLIIVLAFENLSKPRCSKYPFLQIAPTNVSKISLIDVSHHLFCEPVPYTSIRVSDMIYLLIPGSKDKGQGQRFVVAVVLIEVFMRLESVGLRMNVNFVVDHSYHLYPIS